MDFYLDIAETVPAEKLNAYIKRHGYQPLDPSKVSAKQVAYALKYVVESHGLEAYEELKSLKKVEELPAVKEEPQSKNCVSYSCEGCTSCPASGASSKSSAKESSTPSTMASSFSKFVHDNSTVLILATTAVLVAFIVKKYK